MRSSRRDVCVLAGFLGSGKTTLLARYLQERGGTGVAVLINEYGAIGVDHHMVQRVEERTILLEGGCACCSRREELAAALRQLVELDHGDELLSVREVLIETSGLADPVPILFTLMSDPVLRHQLGAASVVVTLDALGGASQIEQHAEIRKQIIAADRVVITKADLADRLTIENCRIRIRRLNPTAKIVVSVLGDAFGVLAPDSDLGHAGDLVKAYGQDFAMETSPHRDVRSTALTFNGPLDWAAFSVWLSMLLQARGPDVLRIKGLLDIGDAGPVVLNVAQHVVHPPDHLPVWPVGERRSYLTVITRQIDPGRIARSMETFQRAGGRAGFRVHALS